MDEESKQLIERDKNAIKEIALKHICWKFRDIRNEFHNILGCIYKIEELLNKPNKE